MQFKGWLRYDNMVVEQCADASWSHFKFNFISKKRGVGWKQRDEGEKSNKSRKKTGVGERERERKRRKEVNRESEKKRGKRRGSPDDIMLFIYNIYLYITFPDSKPWWSLQACGEINALGLLWGFECILLIVLVLPVKPSRLSRHFHHRILFIPTDAWCCCQNCKINRSLSAREFLLSKKQLDGPDFQTLLGRVKTCSGKMNPAQQNVRKMLRLIYIQLYVVWNTHAWAVNPSTTMTMGRGFSFTGRSLLFVVDTAS